MKGYSKKYYKETEPQRKAYHSARRRKIRRAKLMKAWHENNPEANRVYRSRQRMRELGKSDEGSYTREEWIELLQYYQYHCLSCLKIFVEGLEADHVVSLKQGGDNGIDNIQPLCVTCNRVKGTKSVDFRPRWEMLKDKTVLGKMRETIVATLQLKRQTSDDCVLYQSDTYGKQFAVKIPLDVFERNLVIPEQIRVSIEMLEAPQPEGEEYLSTEEVSQGITPAGELDDSVVQAAAEAEEDDEEGEE